jgi:hypothetical protein
METIALSRDRVSAFAAAGVLALTALVLAPAAAHASRLPADPMTLVSAPTLVATQLVNATHATNVWSAIADLRADR